MRIALVGVFTILTFLHCVSQDSLSKFDRFVSLPSKFFQNVNRSAAKFEQKLYSNTDAVLNKLYQQEKKLSRKLRKKDPLLAQKLFSETDSIYSSLKSKISERQLSENLREDHYVPFLDTIRTTYRFLGKNSEQFPNINSKELSDAMLQIQALQGKLNQSEQIQKFIQARKNNLKRELGQLYLVKEFKRLENEVYAYQQTILRYKELLNDSRKLEATAIRLLQKLPVVNDFLNKHSELASLFRLPASGTAASTPLNTQGLQNRAAVLQQVQQTLGVGADPNQLIQQAGLSPESQLNQLKDKLNQLGGGGATDMEMPTYKNSTMHTRSFLQRLEFGMNLQSVKANYYFPVTTDIGLGISYHLNSRSRAGFGIAYKVGLGTGWNNIKVSHQGIGFRTHVELKARGNFWLYGGAEMNYRQEIKRIDVLKNYSAYQKSGLVGISKKYRINKRLNGNMQLLYDFLYAQQIPKGSQFLFRAGYSFSKK